MYMFTGCENWAARKCTKEIRRSATIGEPSGWYAWGKVDPIGREISFTGGLKA